MAIVGTTTERRFPIGRQFLRRFLSLFIDFHLAQWPMWWFRCFCPFPVFFFDRASSEVVARIVRNLTAVHEYRERLPASEIGSIHLPAGAASTYLISSTSLPNSP